MKSKAKLIRINPRKLIYHGFTRGEDVVRYADAMKQGAGFPPIRIYRKFYGDYWKVTDGAHRAAAAKLIGVDVLAETTSELFFGEEDLIVKS